jgi:hypothetical protein
VNQNLALYDIEDVMQQALETGLFVSLCTIQQPSGDLTEDGTPDGLYVDVTGMVAIPCMDAPENNDRITADEVKDQQTIEASNSSHILLSGWYASIEENTDWRAVVTDVHSRVVIYDIAGAESDSQGQMTRLKVKVVTV